MKKKEKEKKNYPIPNGSSPEARPGPHRLRPLQPARPGVAHPAMRGRGQHDHGRRRLWPAHAP
jgi:hypothetical protein